jgi:hypothetical protein
MIRMRNVNLVLRKISAYGWEAFVNETVEIADAVLSYKWKLCTTAFIRMERQMFYLYIYGHTTIYVFICVANVITALSISCVLRRPKSFWHLLGWICMLIR